MMNNLPTLVRLLKQLQQVPYLASKNLYRVVQHFLEMDPERMKIFAQVLVDAHKQLVKCKKCFAWQEREAECMFCSDPQRDHSVVCVVETWHDLFAIERSGAYKGHYHILGGAIHPLDGVGPEDLTIDALIERISSDHKEIILAMNQTPEGDATAAFIARKLKLSKVGSDIFLTCLARGVPVGGSLEYTDRLTVNKALSERRAF